MYKDENRGRIYIIVILVISTILVTSFLLMNCSKDEATEPDNGNGLDVPANPSPANGATDQTLNLTLSWQCTVPEGGSLTFDVYFGTIQDPPLVSSDQDGTSYQPGQLQYNSTYYWKVVAKDQNGNESTGPVWHFQTATVESGLHLIGHYNASNATELCVDGDYAYILSGMLIIDISDPSNPVYAGIYETSPNDFYVSEEYAYFTYGFSYNYHITIVNVSDPAQPEYLDYYYLDDNLWPRDISNIGRYGYLLCSDSLMKFIYYNNNLDYNGGYNIGGNHLYASNDHLCLIGSSRFRIYHDGVFYSYQNDAFGSAQALYPDGNHVYVACDSYGLQIVDISNPTNPSFAGGYITSDNANGVVASGNYAYIAAESAGLIVLDVSDPANPTHVATFEADDSVYDVSIKDGYIFIVAGSAGLYILQFVP